jgi:Zn-dependent M28 family amino/carboxypeptidase
MGIPSIDIIDIDYAYWHTTQDTADKTSPASLEQVGRVLEAWLYQYDVLQAQTETP